jgi:hypothetical protein
MRALARRLTAAVLVAAFCSVAAPASAGKYMDTNAEMNRMPPMFDVLFIRPLAIGMTAVGCVLFLPAAAITAVTRPSEIGKPYRALVANPARYAFSDPIGEHPTR